MSFLNSDKRRELFGVQAPENSDGTVTSDTQAKVYIRELCILVCLFYVENSPSVLSLERLWSELGYSCSWPSGGISQSITKGKRVIESSIENFVRMVTVM